VTDGLVHVGHPLGQIAEIQRPPFEWRRHYGRRAGAIVGFSAASGGRPHRPRPGSVWRGAVVNLRSGGRPARPNGRRFAWWVTSTAMPAQQNFSYSAAAFFTATPSPVASEVAETSGAAARMSTAAGAHEWRRRRAAAARDEPGALKDMATRLQYEGRPLTQAVACVARRRPLSQRPARLACQLRQAAPRRNLSLREPQTLSSVGE